GGKMRRVPQGTAEIPASSSVVPCGTRSALHCEPSTEVLGYFRSSLRDGWGDPRTCARKWDAPNRPHAKGAKDAKVCRSHAEGQVRPPAETDPAFGGLLEKRLFATFA